MNKVFWHCMAGAVALTGLLCGCPWDVPPTIQTSPSTLRMGPGQESTSFVVEVAGFPEKTDLVVEAGPWLEAYPQALTIEDGRPVVVEVRLSDDLTKASHNRSWVTVRAGASRLSRRVDVVLAPDFFAEAFDSSVQFDLAPGTLVFRPDSGCWDYYRAAQFAQAAFVESGVATQLHFPGDRAYIDLEDGQTVPFYGTRYRRLLVYRTGRIDLLDPVDPVDKMEEPADKLSRPLLVHFVEPGVSVLPGTYTVSYKQLEDALVLLFTDPLGQDVAAQVVFWFNGEVWLSHYAGSGAAGVAGLSLGSIPLDWEWAASDLSEYPLRNTGNIPGVAWVD